MAGHYPVVFEGTVANWCINGTICRASHYSPGIPDAMTWRNALSLSLIMAQSEVATAAFSAPLETPRNQTEVYAVHGADPEVLAYAMAKYSRSALSMKE